MIKASSIEFTFTDLKYQGYQKHMYSFINDLRAAIISYNKALIQKRTMAENFMFKGMIVGPDPDMKIIRMVPVKEARKPDNG